MWNIGYSEVLKIDKKNHFQKLSDSVNGKELEEVNFLILLSQGCIY